MLPLTKFDLNSLPIFDLNSMPKWNDLNDQILTASHSSYNFQCLEQSLIEGAKKGKPFGKMLEEKEKKWKGLKWSKNWNSDNKKVLVDWRSELLLTPFNFTLLGKRGKEQSNVCTSIIVQCVHLLFVHLMGDYLITEKYDKAMCYLYFCNVCTFSLVQLCF